MTIRPQDTRYRLGAVALAAALCLPGGSVYAQDAVAGLPSGSDAPVEITADTALEWLRDEKQYVARGRALAQQGEISIGAEVLRAHYRDDGSGGTDIWKLDAEGGVFISSPPHRASGARGWYDIKTGVAVLTGGDLKLVTPTETIRAKDRFEYHTDSGKLLALGGAEAVRGADRLEADTLTAHFSGGEGGKRSLDHIYADNNVVIKTPKETLYGERAVYNVAGQKATLTGNVRILQGENWLQGARAEVNMKTGVSRMFAGGGSANGGKGRVRATFYPEKNNNNTGDE